jgi:hypothetical protein
MGQWRYSSTIIDLGTKSQQTYKDLDTDAKRESEDDTNHIDDWKLDNIITKICMTSPLNTPAWNSGYSIHLEEGSNIALHFISTASSMTRLCYKLQVERLFLLVDMIHCNSAAAADDDENNNNNNNHNLVLSTLAVLDLHIQSHLWQPACISQAETMVIAEKSEFMCGLN